MNNLTAQGLSSTLISIDLEFHPARVSYATIAYALSILCWLVYKLTLISIRYAIGSAIGSMCWGFIADVGGRRYIYFIL